MSGRLLDGAALGRAIRGEVTREVSSLVERGLKPGLAVVLVGDNPASQVYVRGKGKACVEAGMHSETIRLPGHTSEPELLHLTDRLNADPAKDVDGFHPVNVGKLVLGDPSGFRPATPYGVQQMLIRCGIETRGAEAVVVGRSNIVGRPMANLLIQDGPGGNATVTICHSRSRDLGCVTRRADILIAAMGKPEFITVDMVKPGAVVIDVGQNRVEDRSQPKGYRLVGDVAFGPVAEIAGAITPVPGGVGPMTIAMLLVNTLQAARQLGGLADKRTGA